MLVETWPDTCLNETCPIDACFGKCNGRPMEGWARLTRVAVSLLLVGVIVSVSSPTAAVTRWDPRRDAYVDVRKTSKNKVLIDRAPVRLRFKVIATLSNDWSVFVYLDTRGDPGPDYRLGNFETFGMSRCRIRRVPNGDPHPIRCGLKFIDDARLARLWWSVPRHRLSPDKVIRWHVHTHDVGFDPHGRHDDRAPDMGWYP